MRSKISIKSKNRRRHSRGRYKQVLGVTRDMLILSNDNYEQTGLEIVELASRMMEVERF